MLRRNRVAIRRGRRECRRAASAQRLVAKHAEQVLDALASRMLEDGAQRVNPFLGLDRIVVVHDAHATLSRDVANRQRRAAMNLSRTAGPVPETALRDA